MNDEYFIRKQAIPLKIYIGKPNYTKMDCNYNKILMDNFVIQIKFSQT